MARLNTQAFQNLRSETFKISANPTSLLKFPTPDTNAKQMAADSSTASSIESNSQIKETLSNSETPAMTLSQSTMPKTKTSTPMTTLSTGEKTSTGAILPQSTKPPTQHSPKQKRPPPSQEAALNIFLFTPPNLRGLTGQETSCVSYPKAGSCAMPEGAQCAPALKRPKTKQMAPINPLGFTSSVVLGQ